MICSVFFMIPRSLCTTSVPKFVSKYCTENVHNENVEKIFAKNLLLYSKLCFASNIRYGLFESILRPYK